MASVQERLQLKRVPLENWSVSEQLYLASAVANSGDQNWMSVSRQLKAVCGNNRPSDWFSQKSCAAQYEMLLENVEPTKRKKRNEKDTGQTIVETPIQLLVRKLKQERIIELNKLIQDEREEFQKIRTEIQCIQNNAFDENQLRDMLLQIENEEKQREREKQKYALWLKEREERKRELERTWRTNTQLHQHSPTTMHSPLAKHLNQNVKVEDAEVDDPNAKQGTSPLLTSLLKSPSAAPNPSPSMLHNLPNQTRVAAPTITNLLTGSVSNLTSSLAAAQQTGTKTMTSSMASITTPYPSQMHNQPLVVGHGPPPNDQTTCNIPQSPSQAAPTLSMLLENKQKESILKMPPLARIDTQTPVCATDQNSGGDLMTKTEPTDAEFNSAESPIKDEDQQLMEVFNELIPDDIGELADILLDDLINEEQVAAVSHAAENLEGQVNLDLKHFQSQAAHVTEVDQVKEEPISENASDSIAASIKMEDTFQALKEQKDTDHLIAVEKVEKVEKVETVENVENEEDVENVQNVEDDADTDSENMKNVPSDLPKDDDSDLSNDTPLSELIKQEESAKKQRSQSRASKDISSTTEQPEEIQPTVEPDPEQVPERKMSEHLTSDDENIEDATDLLEDELAQPDNNYSGTGQQNHPNDFEIKSPKSEEKPPKVEIEMPIDSFESDSNEEKSMENIKRKIEALPELKDSNSSENSQDEKLDTLDSMLIEERLDSDGTDKSQEKPDEDSANHATEVVEQQFENADQLDESIIEAEPNVEKDEIVDSPPQITDEISDVTTTKDEAIEQTEPEETACDMEVEQPESMENESTASMDIKSCPNETVEPPPEETTEQPAEENTTTETTIEILDDEILEKTKTMETAAETEAPEESKPEVDSLKPETEDTIEIKSDDEKPEPSSPEEKVDKCKEAVSIKIETDYSTTDDKESSAAPAVPAERKVSTDDELFEDAKETLDIEVKPSKPITPIITCDTDDDSPIEVVKEEKVGVKRDYSRRKKDQSHSEKKSEEITPSEDFGGSISSRLRLKERDRSESPFIEEDSGEPLAKNKRRYSSTPVIDSLPNSPASSDDREYRSWKKSILLVYNTLAAHKCASIFAKPITEEQAPNYKTVILQPMDLQSLKRNIDSGQIRTTIDFKLYIMRMCYNAIFYNVNDDITCSRAKEMFTDAVQSIDDFSITWKKENEKPVAAVSNISSVSKSVRGRKSNRLMN